MNDWNSLLANLYRFILRNTKGIFNHGFQEIFDDAVIVESNKREP